MLRHLLPLVVVSGVCAWSLAPAWALDAFDRHGLAELRELGKSGTPVPELAPGKRPS